MKRTTALGVFVLALALALVAASVPGAFAQDPRGGGGGGGQGSAGSAAAGAARGGGGDTGGSRGGGSVSSAPAPSGGGYSGGSPVWSGGNSGGGSAVPRGAGRNPDGAGGRQPSGGGAGWSGANASTEREGRPVQGSSFRRSPVDDEMAGRSRAGAGSSGVESSVPWYARSRGGNPSTGTAVPRPDVPGNKPQGIGGAYSGYYPGYYDGYPAYVVGYWGSGYYDCYYRPYACNHYWGYSYGAFGLGYFYFDPFGWNYGDYARSGGGGGGGSFGAQQMGSIRLKVKPSNAAIFVDGYYAGTVDDFDNSFQKLSVALGTHKIEISAPGYEPLIFEIDVRDFETITYQGQLVPIR